MLLVVLLCSLFVSNIADNNFFDTKCDHSLSRCFKYVSAPATYSDAEETCINEGGHLVSIENGFIGATIRESATHAFSVPNFSNFWIGANFIFNNRWSWTDGTEFSYSNWAPGEPANNESVAMQIKTDRWITADHTISKPFVCEIAMASTKTSTPPSCPKTYSCESGWTYFKNTESCYKSFFTASFSVAEATCVQHGGHLTSIHNDDDNNFVSELVYTGPVTSMINQTWIGVYRQTGSSVWTWTDGTEVDYVAWGGGQDHPYHGADCNCVLLASNDFIVMDGWARKWDNYPCDTILRNFVCQTAAV